MDRQSIDQLDLEPSANALAGHPAPTVSSLMAAFKALAKPDRAAVADLVASLKEVQRLAAARHAKSIEASRSAISRCRDALDRSDPRRPPATASAPPRAAAPAQAPRVSDSQWIVYFLLEFAAAAPGVARDGAFRIASAARSMARHVEPEVAAASVAVGISAVALH